MTPQSLSGLDPRDLGDVLAHTSRLQDALRGARILVTGATGWFGTWLLDALVAIDRHASLGLRIVAVSRNPGAFARRHPRLHAARQIQWVVTDVRDADWHVDGPVTHVLHGATDASAKLNAEDPDRMFDTIVTGTRNILRIAAAHAGAKVLLVGSGAVYGGTRRYAIRWSEDDCPAADLLDPANAYAEGKRAAEHLAALWHESHDIDVKLARCFAFVGPHMPFDTHFAIGNFIRDAQDSDAIRIAGDGTPLRSYLYLSDCVAWLLTILVEGTTLRPYNVGADEAVSIGELARRCAAVADHPVDVVTAGRPGGGDYVPDISRARSELGLDVRVPLADAIRRTAAWRRRVLAPVDA